VEPADLVQAQHLHCAVGSPVARILRQLHGADRRVAYSALSWYRGEAFEMDITLPCDRGGQFAGADCVEGEV